MDFVCKRYKFSSQKEMEEALRKTLTAEESKAKEAYLRSVTEWPIEIASLMLANSQNMSNTVCFLPLSNVVKFDFYVGNKTYAVAIQRNDNSTIFNCSLENVSVEFERPNSSDNPAFNLFDLAVNKYIPESTKMYEHICQLRKGNP